MTFRHFLALGTLALASLTTLVAQQPRTNEFHPIGFDQLAGFNFATPTIDNSKPIEPQVAAITERIPWSVRKFDGAKVVMSGYMLPVVVEDGLVRQFILMKDQQGCCYGTMPAMNEWVLVNIPSGVNAAMDETIFIYGTIKVGAQVEEGYLAGIYAIDGVYLKR
ncbi:hypothetical protein MASR2M8_21220 [Opitutaceae bacterium]